MLVQPDPVDDSLPPLVDRDDWAAHADRLSEGAQVRLHLLDEDVRSAQIALADYQEAVDDGDHERVIHHAKVFVCSMRRAARLLEAVASKRSELPPHVAEAARLAWRKKRSQLNGYTAARNAIEHIDGEAERLAGKELLITSLLGDTLIVTQELGAGPVAYDPKIGRGARVHPDELRLLLGARDEIMSALKAWAADTPR